MNPNSFSKDLIYHIQCHPLPYIYFTDNLRVKSFSKSISEIPGISTKNIKGIHIETFLKAFLTDAQLVDVLNFIESSIKGVEGEFSFMVSLNGQNRKRKAWYLNFTANYEPSSTHLLSLMLLIEEEKNFSYLNRRLKNATKEAKVGIWSFDVKNELFDFSNTWLAEINSYPDKVKLKNMKKAYGSVFRGEDLENFKSHINKIRNGEIDEFEIELQNKNLNGGWRWKRCTGQLKGVNDKGEIERVEGIYIDISDLKSAKKATRFEKQLRSDMIENVPGIYTVIDSDNKLIDYSKLSEKLLGLKAGETIKELTKKLQGDKFRDKYFSELKNVFNNKDVVKVTFNDEEGEEKKFLLSGSKIETDQQTYRVGTGVDVTEKDEAVNRLKIKERQFAQLFENSPAAIASIDANHCIERINKSFRRLFKYSDEEASGKHIDQLLTADGDGIGNEKIESLIQDDGSVKGYFERVRLDKYGKDIPVLINASPIYLDGQIQHYLVIYTDISDKVRNQLIIEKSLDEKAILLQEIHHRVKNNLAIVAGLLTLKQFQIENEELKDSFAQGISYIKAMALVHETLYQSSDYSSIPFSEYVSKLFEQILLSMGVTEHIELIMETVDDVTLNVNQAIPSGLILNEFVTNSVKYAFNEQEKSKIYFSLRYKNGVVSFKVRDNGVGFPLGFENNSSLGITIIQQLLSQLEAQHKIYNHEGAVLEFSFKKSDKKGAHGNPVS